MAASTAMAQTNTAAPPPAGPRAAAAASTNAAARTNAPPSSESIDIDGYAAKVNDRVITMGEVHAAMAPMLPELYRMYQGADLEAALARAYRQTLDELIAQALILEVFETRGGTIPDQYVNDEIRRIINDRFKGDEAQFEQVLAREKKSRSEYMEEIRNQLIVGMMVNEEVNQRARATPEEVRSYYESHRDTDYYIPEKVKYSVIALSRGETAEEQSVKLAEARKIREKLAEGADFAETAREVSEGSRAAEGGEFPWMQPADARPELQDTLLRLQAGELSDIIEAESQLYLVKLEARRQPGYRSFDEVRDDIKNLLLARERQRLRERWIERLRAEKYVRIYTD
jgi:parvulin-like peptidyl-prolyl isomerase